MQDGTRECALSAIEDQGPARPGGPLRGQHKVSTEIALNVLAYNVKRVIAALGCRPLLEAMHTSAPGGSLNAQMSQEIACDGCRGPHAFNRLKRSRRARRSKQTRR